VLEVGEFLGVGELRGVVAIEVGLKAAVCLFGMNWISDTAWD
jgi:anaerobic C4-dicarboxylate transporter